MITYLKLAWRNLWRNKKRTLISAASVFFAVILSLIMRSMQNGYYDYMINSSVRLYTGHIQVHGKDFWEKRSLEESMYFDETVIQKLKKNKNISQIIPRLETFSLISSGKVSKVVQVNGITPQIENDVTKLKDKLTDGEYLNENSDGILLTEGLAKLLGVQVGDSIILYGQGFHGVTAAAVIPVEGIVKFAIPDQNKSFTYLALNYSQQLFSAYDRITSLSILLKDADEIESTKTFLKNYFDNSYEIMDWAELSPELVQSIQVDNASGIIMLGILYVVIAFGIFGTIMMMTAERVKEFGILISIGMKKSKLAVVTILETIFISFIGVAAGALISIPILLYLVNHPIPLTGETADAILAWGFDPIIPFAFYPGMYFAQIWTVLAIAFVSALYPVNFIRKIKPSVALRG
ncbi:ABC-type transport system (lipoprotein release), permease component [Ignavibacterium album JCM 16511]|uniref:ABC-type transport system (Lipoprotein release), permease component n=1 Tax=Ignavibacterium album (strain DSM 19864 / JCM 16511 / NBRC 101810 / Mat9-16) TaxID=945713 RepID=I0APD1_IGNAJ|nr:FtsX-like permease family protein [Ignavibacterium album]AFH50838.1 ABC-type transport system (lipoprotein release), permease component [Ignavibacterium album JCM 16511]